MPIAVPEVVLQGGALQGCEDGIEPVSMPAQAVAVRVQKNRGKPGRLAGVLGLQLLESVDLEHITESKSRKSQGTEWAPRNCGSDSMIAQAEKQRAIRDGRPCFSPLTPML